MQNLEFPEPVSCDKVVDLLINKIGIRRITVCRFMRTGEYFIYDSTIELPTAYINGKRNNELYLILDPETIAPKSQNFKITYASGRISSFNSGLDKTLAEVSREIKRQNKTP